MKLPRHENSDAPSGWLLRYLLNHICLRNFIGKYILMLLQKDFEPFVVQLFN